MNVYALAVGVVSAGVGVLLFKVWGIETTRWAYPVLLAEFPVNYWAFAIYGSDSAALPKEILASAVFLAVAYIAYRFRSVVTLLLLAVGYFLHAAYDCYHDSFFSNAGTPTWWPEFCGSADILLGAYVAYLALVLSRKSVVT
jgi:hypothetical protein